MPTRGRNPYRPGFNQAPLVLSGRDRVLAAIDEALAVAALDGRTPRPLVITGARGIGKTVLLGEAAARAAESHSWLTAPVEIRAGSPFVPHLVARLTTVRDLYRQAKPGGRVEISGATVRASVLGVGGEVELRRTRPPEDRAATLETALAEACAAAAEHSAGVLVTIDELQLASRRELGELAATLQQHVPDDWPLVVVLAGLPNVRGTHRSVTYLERAEWHVIGPLDGAATLEALQAPARGAGRPMSDDAAAVLANASGGYPYAVQLLGHHAWRASAGSDVIEQDHASAAVSDAQQELAAGLYVSRWEGASEREREYLAALAGLASGHGRVTGAMVAERLGKTPKSVSYLRDRLIQKGTIFAEGRILRFAVPGFADWLLAGPGATDRPDQPDPSQEALP